MNSIYVFHVRSVCTAYIAARSWKTARNIALQLPQFQQYGNVLPQVVGYRIASGCTEKEGEITLKEICKEHPWWECPECSGKVFILLDGTERYRCQSCGYEGSTPIERLLKEGKNQ